MTWLRWIVVSSLSVLGFGASAAEPKVELRFPYTSIAPLVMRDSCGEVRGIVPSQVRRLARNADLGITFVDVPGSHSRDALQQRNITMDLDFPGTWRDEHMQRLNLSVSVDMVRIERLSEPSRAAPTTTAIYSDSIRPLVRSTDRAVVVRDFNEMARLWVLGQIDAVIGPKEPVLYALFLQGVKPSDVTPRLEVLSTAHAFIYVDPSIGTDVIARLETAGEEMGWPPSLAQLRERYLSQAARGLKERTPRCERPAPRT
jgi:hypothetical protein